MSDVNSVEVTLKLTVAEVNAVLTMLGKGPFEQVYGLIQKIKEQGESQLAAEPVASEPEQLNG